MEQAIDRAHDMTRFWWTCARLTSDSQSVVTMRMMGLSGAWLVPDGENDVMISEKVPAFTEALVSGVLTAMSGQGPDRVMQAVIEPLFVKANANRVRLATCGPRLAGIDAARSYVN